MVCRGKGKVHHEWAAFIDASMVSGESGLGANSSLINDLHLLVCNLPSFSGSEFISCPYVRGVGSHVKHLGNREVKGMLWVCVLSLRIGGIPIKQNAGHRMDRSRAAVDMKETESD